MVLKIRECENNNTDSYNNHSKRFINRANSNENRSINKNNDNSNNDLKRRTE